MSILPALESPKIKQFEEFHSTFNKYETIKKVLKISAIILGFAAIGCLSSLLIYQISSDLLLGSIILSSASSIICLLTKCILSHFQSRITKPNNITPEEVIKSLDLYNSKFPYLDPKKYIGKIEKIDLEKDSKLIIKADLHGDFFSLIELLKNLQKQKILDQNLKVTKEYKDKIVIAFLGDYLDRGEYSFEIIDLLIKLKINNPNEFVLLKGNHENREVSSVYIHNNERHFYQNKTLCEKLDRFFTTLPLSVLVGTKDTDNKYQYTLLTHGALDPDIDLNELLESRSSRSVMYIKNDKKACLSKRIQNLLPKDLKNKELSEIEPETRALEKYIKTLTNESLQEAKRLLKTSSLDKKKAKQILGILKVQDFLKTYSKYIEDSRKDNITSFSWGDISKNYSGINFARGAGICLTPELIKEYFRAVSLENRKIKALRAGHAHQYKEFSINGKKGFIEILPVAGELKDYDPLRSPIDMSEMITIAPKVKEWKKQILSRARASDFTTVSSPKVFYGLS